MSDIVSLEGVHRRFGKVKALDGLSLTVREGEVYGFLGRNGAGKTTTLRILMGILSADSGTVSVLGQSGKRLPTQLKQRIGYVSQEQHFYPWMTAQQLGQFVAGFYPTWDETEFRRLLKVLDVPYTRRNVELSGGSRTKLGLALALAPRPPLLLLDEPTAGLDPVARREFNDLVATTVRDRGTTAFFSSHLVDEVQQIAHRVAIIQAGSARFEGEVATLRASVRKLVLPTPAPIIELRGGSAAEANAAGATADTGTAPAVGGAAASGSTAIGPSGEGGRAADALGGAAATVGASQAPNAAAPRTPARGSTEGALGTATEPASAPPFGGVGASAGSSSLDGAVVSANAPWPAAAPSADSPSTVTPAAREPLSDGVMTHAPSPDSPSASTSASSSEGAASPASIVVSTNAPSSTSPAASEDAPSSAAPASASSAHLTAERSANAATLGDAASTSAPPPTPAAANANAASQAAATGSNAPSLDAGANTRSPPALSLDGVPASTRSPHGETGAAADAPRTDVAGASAAVSSAAPSVATRDEVPSPGELLTQPAEARPADVTSVFTAAGATSDEDTLPPVVPHTARAPVLYFLKPEPAMTNPPVGFTRLRGEVWRAAPELWESTPWPEGTVVDTLSLEDIFLAFARTDAAP